MRKVKIVNCTPHPIKILKVGIQIEFPPEEISARCIQSTKVVETVEDINSGILFSLTATTYGEVIGLPDPEEGTHYIVSKIVAERCKKRKDLLIPNGVQVDSKGNVTGCISLSKF